MAKRRSRFGSVRKLPSGRWQARYERGGEWHYAPVTFRENRLAWDWLDDQQSDRRFGNWVDPQGGKTRFEDWATIWKSHTVNLRESTKARDFGYVDRYMIPTFGDTPLSAIDHLSAQDWVAGLSRSGLAPATVSKAAQIMSKIMAASVVAGLLAVNPCANVSVPKIEREEMNFLTFAEVGVLAGTIDPRYRAVVYVGAFGGLRMGETFGLRRGKVDTRSGRLSVTESLVEVEGHLFTEPCKTRASVRSVVLPDVARLELKSHLGPAGAVDDYVFEAPNGGPVRLASWRQRYWNKATAACGFEGLRPHDLRHTAAALMIEAGASPLQVSRRLGHTSVAFTLDRYGHLMHDAEEKLNEKLNTLAETSGTNLARRQTAKVAN